jgi:hypothetical protein
VSTRTTITIDEDLLADVKTDAARTGRTLSEWLADSARERLARRAHTQTRRPVRLPTNPGGLRPGVDLDHSAAVWELLDQDEFEQCRT